MRELHRQRPAYARAARWRSEEVDALLDADPEAAERACERARRQAALRDEETETAPAPHVVPDDEGEHGTWKETLEDLWSKVQADAYPALPPETAPPLNPAFVRAENLDTAFKHPGEVLPRGVNGMVQEKMIHPFGVVARFRLRINRGPYSGILAAGQTSEGLIRMSNGSSGTRLFSPGVAFKIPRTDRRSADMLFGTEFPSTDRWGPAWPHPARQKASRFLVPDQQTWLGSLPLDHDFRDLRTLFWIFNKMREDPQFGNCRRAFAGQALSVKPLCTHTQEGEEEACQDPPGLLLRATKGARRAYRAAWAKARARSFFRSSFREAFLLFEPPLELYEVWARDEHEKLEEIGTLELTSRFVASAFGDNKLFFRHADPCPHASVLPG